MRKFLQGYKIDTIPGAVAPLGIFDPFNLGRKADDNTLKRYREAELVHGRISMLATTGFIAGEAVEGSSFLFDASVSGPAIDHPFQVPAPFWTALVLFIVKLERDRAEIGWVDPADAPFAEPGLLRAEYEPGDYGFDPFKLRTNLANSPSLYIDMQNKELQNGRLAMIAAAGFLAQEAVNKKGIIENLVDMMTSFN
jgi:Chlorophyll A-B binding protein